MKEVNDATFAADVIERSKNIPVIVDLWAPWCEPCKALTPIIENAVTATAVSYTHLTLPTILLV